MVAKQYLTGKIYSSQKEIMIKKLCNLFLAVCIVFSLAIATFDAMFFKAEVIGRSMQPTLNEDEHKRDTVYASTFLGYGRGDIIIVALPNYEKDGIKRLIAIGGDELYFGDLDNTTEDKIYLNGKELDESYLKVDNTSVVNQFKEKIKQAVSGSSTNWEGFTVKENDGKYSMVLDKDYCVYLGDNRPLSYDCSDFGPQKMSVIEAQVFLIIPYGFDVYTHISNSFFKLFKKS